MTPPYRPHWTYRDKLPELDGKRVRSYLGGTVEREGLSIVPKQNWLYVCGSCLLWDRKRGLPAIMAALRTHMKRMHSSREERRVGYWGRDDTPVGVALAGILHLEAEPRSFTALCNDQELDSCWPPSRILEDPGYQIRTLRICKRCEKKEKKDG